MKLKLAIIKGEGERLTRAGGGTFMFNTNYQICLTLT